jgi:hypothetical protein
MLLCSSCHLPIGIGLPNLCYKMVVAHKAAYLLVIHDDTAQVLESHFNDQSSSFTL